MKTPPVSTKVTVRFTLDVDRTLTLTQHNKPKMLTNVEWAKEQIEMICQELETYIDGQRVECQWRVVDGDLPAEICEDEESETEATP